MVRSIATTGQPTTLGNPFRTLEKLSLEKFWNPLVISLTPGEILKFPMKKKKKKKWK